MHGFGTPVKRPPDSITPRFRRPMRTTSTLQKFSYRKKEGPQGNGFQPPPTGLQCASPRATSIPPSLPFFGKQEKPLNRDSIRSKILGGEGGGLEGGGEPFSRRVPLPPPISHNNLLPERHAHVAVDEHVRLHVLADGLRRGGGKLREDFVGIAL